MRASVLLGLWVVACGGTVVHGQSDGGAGSGATGGGGSAATGGSGGDGGIAAYSGYGGDGGVAGGSNVIPDQFVGWFRAVKDGDEEAARQFRSVVEGFQDIYEIGKYTSRYIKGTKSALSLIGICSDLPADPFHPFLAPERARVAEVLKRIGLENLHG